MVGRPPVCHITCLLKGRDSPGWDGFTFYTVPCGARTSRAACSNAIAIFSLCQSLSLVWFLVSALILISGKFSCWVNWWHWFLPWVQTSFSQYQVLKEWALMCTVTARPGMWLAGVQHLFLFVDLWNSSLEAASSWWLYKAVNWFNICRQNEENEKRIVSVIPLDFNVDIRFAQAWAFLLSQISSYHGL